jgi:hypothetical protein
MKIAHLILAHTAPEQLYRLVKRLAHQDAFFFIHVDLKADVTQFASLLQVDKVTFVKERINVKWGAYSIVQATLNGFKTILCSGQAFDYINLLSGVDYPIRSTPEIHKFLSAHTGKNFMHALLINDEWQEAITRLTEYHFTHYTFPAQYKLQKIINRILPARKMPHNLIPVGRSQWFTITGDAMEYLADYLDKHKEVVRFFKLTWAPDEIIFQTLLYNSPFQKSMVNDNLCYVDWSAGTPSPRILSMEDKDALQASGKFFARKFDMKLQPGILDYLDAINDVQ